MAVAVETYCGENNIEFVKYNSDTDVLIKAKACGHNKTTTWEDIQKEKNIHLCDRCYEKKKLKFARLVKVFKEQGCKVLGDEEDFINNNMFSDTITDYLIEYTMPCGHTMISTYGEFQDGPLCNSCA